MKIELIISFVYILTSTSLFAQVDSILPEKDSTITEPPATKNISSSDSIAKPGNKSSSEVYKLNPAIDIPVTAIGTGWSLYAFTKIYEKGASDTEDILALKKEDVPSFDRWYIKPYDKSLDEFSYIPFYAAMPLPLLYSLTGKETRKDFFKLSFLYLEALSITGLFGTGATYFVDRYRPYAYTTETDIEKRTGENAKNSFYAGHVQIVAVSTFFLAKVHNDYYPDSKNKWIFWTGASAATAWMSYMRLQGGLHFPSEVLLGSAMGALSGILVPHYHKNTKDKSLSVLPYQLERGMGLALNYRF